MLERCEYVSDTACLYMCVCVCVCLCRAVDRSWAARLWLRRSGGLLSGLCVAGGGKGPVCVCARARLCVCVRVVLVR